MMRSARIFDDHTGWWRQKLMLMVMIVIFGGVVIVLVMPCGVGPCHNYTRFYLDWLCTLWHTGILAYWHGLIGNVRVHGGHVFRRRYSRIFLDKGVSLVLWHLAKGVSCVLCILASWYLSILVCEYLSILVSWYLSILVCEYLSILVSWWAGDIWPLLISG